MNTPNPRYQRPQRLQLAFDSRSLEQLLTPDHVARLVWDFVERLDLAAFHATVKAVRGRPGTPPIDPRILLALWLLATLDGVSSARELDRLWADHTAYRWVCGEVGVNYHTLSDFRTDHGELFDQLLTQSVAALLHEGLVDLDEVAQDGMRVRASAGSSSFRRQASLEECLATAQERVAELTTTDGTATTRQRATRERAAWERVERVTRALATREELAAQQAASASKSGRTPKEPRVSTTDPDARRMAMADGGTRPAYNVELATTTGGGIIVGVAVVRAGTDHGQLTPMVDQMVDRFGVGPRRVVADGGFGQHADLEALHEREVASYVPVKASKKVGVDPHEPKRGDGPGVSAWRVRMGTAAAAAIYAKRGEVAEWVNARFRNWGLSQYRVRGLAAVGAVTKLLALTHNLVQGLRLRTAATAA
jgi:transposase